MDGRRKEWKNCIFGEKWKTNPKIYKTTSDQLIKANLRYLHLINNSVGHKGNTNNGNSITRIPEIYYKSYFYVEKKGIKSN